MRVSPVQEAGRPGSAGRPRLRSGAERRRSHSRGRIISARSVFASNSRAIAASARFGVARLSEALAIRPGRCGASGPPPLSPSTDRSGDDIVPEAVQSVVAIGKDQLAASRRRLHLPSGRPDGRRSTSRTAGPRRVSTAAPARPAARGTRLRPWPACAGAGRIGGAIDDLGLIAVHPPPDRVAALAHDGGDLGDGEAMLGHQQDHLGPRADPNVTPRSVEIVKLAQLIDVQRVQMQGAHRSLLGRRPSIPPSSQECT